MDSGFETIIYIILGVVFVVAQVIKKKKPKRAVEGVEGQVDTSSEVNSSKGLLEQFLGFDEVEDPFDKAPVKDVTPIQTSSPFTPLSSKENEIDVLPYQQFGEKGKEVDRYKETIEITEDQKRKANRGQNFDLRKAVIYSAILERKYF